MGQPLLGREGVLAAVQRHREAGGSVVLIYGAAGVGRTRLAWELVNQAEARGVGTSWSVATSAAATIPFAALTDLLAAPATQEETADAVLQASRRRLEQRASAIPLLIAIDDAHLLDAGSLALVHSLVTVPQISLVLTVRGPAPAPEELTSLWKDRGALRVDLDPLDRTASDRLVAATLGGPAETKTLTALWQLTRGNPMVLREVLLGTQEQGGLVQAGGRWRLVSRPHLSLRLSELVAARLEGLGDDAVRGLVALSLAEPLGYMLLRQLVGPDAIERLEESGVTEVVHEGLRHKVRFAQAIDGEVVRATASHSRVLTVAEALLTMLGGDDVEGSAIASSARRREDVLLLAELWRHAGRPQGGSLFLAGAREALARGANSRAVALAELAVERDGGVAARAIHGEALAYLGRGEDAEHVLSQAAAAAGSETDIVQTALLRFHNQLFSLADPDGADQIITTARQLVMGRDERDQLDAALALSATLRGDLRRTLTVSASVLERDDADPRTLLSVLVLSSVCRVMLGDISEAQRDVRRAKPLLASMRELMPLAADQIGIAGVLALWHDGRCNEAVVQAQDGYTGSLEGDANEQTGGWATTLGLVLAEAGRLSDAAELCREAAARLENGDPLGLRGTALAGQARCAAALGDLTAAQALLDEIAGLHGQDLRTDIHTARAEVWFIAARGEVARASAHALEHGQQAIANTHLTWGAMLLHDAVRFGYPDETVEALGCLATVHDAYLLQLQAHHASALAETDPEGLLEVATAFSECGFPVYAAEAMAQAADLFQRQGHTMAARRSNASAASLVSRLHPVTTPALLSTADPLTTREREVAHLARHGIASRQIGAQLGLSVRTVDNYLASVYRKTGIKGRHQLGLVLRIPMTDATS